jgi:hypothetical protein
MLLCLLLVTSRAAAAVPETLWIEAEHLDGVRGYCWPMGRPDMKKTQGNWGLSGPGWAAEWNQGSESGFLSIATGAEDDKAVATKTIDIPVEGRYCVWVRYGDWRERTERFEIKLEQEGQPAWSARFGETPAVEEDNEMKLYWGWSFAWAKREAPLKEGKAKLSLVSTTQDPVPRQIDVIVLTTDTAYRPRIKERPTNPARQLLEMYRAEIPDDLEPLARRTQNYQLPDAWKLRSFRDKGFLYLWNTRPDKPANWLSDEPDRVLYPYNVADDDTRTEFEKKYGGKKDVPIFSDPRVVPTFHGVGAGIFATDPKTGELLEAGQRFARWLDEHPERNWAMMMNYHGGVPVGEKGVQTFEKYRGRFVGSIAGESLGYFEIDPKVLAPAVEKAQTRRQLVDALRPLSLEANAAKYRKVYGRDIDANPFADVISCLSIGNIAFVPVVADWGAKTVGYESSSIPSSVLAMRWAFMRGSARQNNALTATYRSCNFGDASTIFSIAQSYSSPRNIYDNYYSVYSGAGMTWYKMDIWYQYMAGASMFYHEQGFDEFWKPGGTTAAGIHEVQLSPKGQLVDRFLRLTAEQPERGEPFTPVAFLVDYAHGWEPAPFWPNSFNNHHHAQERFLYGDHERMLEQFFWTAFHPIAVEAEKPMTATNEVYLPGVFGDIFDVIYAYPDVAKWRTIDSYPVVIVAGDIELTEAEGQRLAEYMERGGTLWICDAHLTGPGVAALKLPELGATAVADRYRWGAETNVSGSPRFQYRPITLGTGRSLATTPTGEVFCAAFDRGQGRLIQLAIPRGMTIGRQASPLLPILMAHLTRGLMPIEVDGDVEWLLNRTSTGWVVTLMNPAGQAKPQQGITPTDYRENRSVVLRFKVPVQMAHDRMLKTETLTLQNGVLKCEVPAGGVRIIELR